MRRSQLASSIVLAALLLEPLAAHAEPPTAPAATPPAKDPAYDPAAREAMSGDQARYAYLKAELDALEGPTERWFTGWTWTYGWLAGGNVLLAATSPTSDLRAVSIVSAVESAAAMGIVVFSPNTIRRDWKRVRALPSTTPFEAYAQRVHAEEILRAVAFEEWFQHSILTHGLVFVASAAGGAVLHWGVDVPLVPSILVAAGSFAVAEVQIWSRPFGGTNAWDHYVKDFHPGDPHLAPAQYTISLGVSPMGIAAHGTF